MKKVYHAESSFDLHVQSIDKDLNAKKVLFGQAQGALLRAKNECKKSMGASESIEAVSELTCMSNLYFEISFLRISKIFSRKKRMERC